MYILLFSLIVALGAGSIYLGILKHKKLPVVAGLLILISLAVFIWFMGFWAEKLWFESLGYSERFWTEFFARLASGGSFLLFGALFILLFTFSIPGMARTVRLALSGFGALLGVFIGSAQWQSVLRFLNRIDSGVTDPLLNMDAGFYLFTLPFIDTIYGFLISLAVISLIVGIIASLPRGAHFLRGEYGQLQDETGPGYGSGLIIAAALFLLFLSAGKILGRFHLMYAYGGTVSGPGWTDHHIRLPALLIAAFTGGAGAVLLMIPAFRNLTGKLSARLVTKRLPREIHSVLGLYAGVAVLWFIALLLAPWLAQSLLVAPNELTYERPYIGYNIEYTRKAFKLDDIREEEYPAGGDFTRRTAEENRGVIDNTRLWDWRALSSVYQQFQEIRLYYEFGDIDVDRYMINGRRQAVMVAAREMETSNLPADSQNFVNTRFKYTHGYGIAMNNVNEFTSSGLPELLIRDIPPQSDIASLRVERPEIYYSERSDSHVVVNSSEEEFDYPEGDSNRYVHYEGDGGVRISSLFRKFIFGYLFDGTSFLLSSYPTAESRIMFHRNIRDRVMNLAPFLELDGDPYIVLVNGELRWIIDAYTTADSYPYSDHFVDDPFNPESEGPRTNLTESLSGLPRGTNYIRNSIKGVVNPYNGDVDFYVYDSEDPIIRVWQRIYPELFKEKNEMPEELRQHVRYPADFLQVQGAVYARYHMRNPEVFYNQEDLWVRATEKYYDSVQPVEPYYIMWERPGSDEAEFILMLPYTPKSKQVLIGWIAGVSDPENYGEFIAYRFPKEQRILGPQQMETKIDQDSFLSGQLSLWNQRGSNVIRGNVLVLPLNGTLLYVEPIYLQSETAAYPELRMVVLMHKDTMVYAETLDSALEKLYAAGPEGAAETGQSKTVTATASGDASGKEQQELIRQAAEAFDAYIQNTGSSDFDAAASELRRLQKLLNELTARD
ncbi:UPF0182 family protein [Marispirochaeta aestuarii]|uniref:UPF0182 family membrane protein n=1 Tax=Marispirochaeta aestuarii TaxID=1963862 RepID=UPI0029C90467|nr:UPF0182 family protein [Marispirochaeta aestuarii]